MARRTTLAGAGVAPSAAKLGRAAVLAGVASRGQGRFPVFATGPVVTLAHSQTIADQGEKKDRHCEVHSSRQTPSTASSPWPLFVDSLRALATKARIGRHVGAWWRRPQASDGSPNQPAPGDSRSFLLSDPFFASAPSSNPDSRGDHTDACHIIPPGQRDLGQGRRERDEYQADRRP